MAGLRLMTFNVQMLPLPAMILAGQSDDSPDRAERVAKAILSLPARERPDVIAFNEVFAEDGRAVLVDRLSTDWPHFIEQTGDIPGLQDSGLMLFSRLPLLRLPSGEDRYERRYSDAADTDLLAEKSVVVVQVARPGDVTTIAYTHMQAAYTSDTEYHAIRKKQFRTILGAISKALRNEAAGSWQDVIVIGDLNVRGDDANSEWNDVFADPDAEFGKVFSDGWNEFMHPPFGSNDPGDPGYSNIELSSGKLRRLDYQCFSRRRASGPWWLVPHHMMIRLRDQSDHFALESYIAPWVPHCTPAEAIRFSALPSVMVAGEPSTLKVVELAFPNVDAYQWVYVNQPGTYTIHAEAKLDVRLYLTDDLSQPITPADTLDVSKLPPQILQGLVRLQLVRKGQTFAVRRPFFIAVTTGTAYPRQGSLTVYRHNGDTQERAIWLTPHTDIKAGFPRGQALGTDDVCWFKAAMTETYAAEPRTETFAVSNPYGEYLEFTLKDDALGTLDSASGKDADRSLAFRAVGKEVVYLTLQRGDKDENDFKVRWTSPVSYLALDKETGFFITEESGAFDEVGDDEIQLDIKADDRDLFSEFWDDADEGERWPGFAEALKTRLAAAMPGARRLPFVRAIDIACREKDVTATSAEAGRIAALAPGDPDLVAHRIRLVIDDDASDGIYTLYCSVSRFPE